MNDAQATCVGISEYGAFKGTGHNGGPPVKTMDGSGARAFPESVTGWPLFWDARPSALDAKKALRLIANANSRNQKMLAALANVRQNAGVRAGRRLQRRYLLSFGAKLAAFVQAWQAKIGPISKCSDEQAVDLVRAADSLSAWHPSRERARAWPKLKRDGENYRWLHAFQLGQTALDKLATNAARCFSDLLPTQFSQTGKGIGQFEAWLDELMPKIKTIVTVDIPSCFDVLRRSNVEVNLFLSKQVVEAAMFIPMNKAIRLSGVHTGIHLNDTYDVGTSATKRGVPQGSALAQLAADIEIDKVLRAVASVHGSVHVAAYGDNLIFLLEDAGWLGSVKNALTNATTKIFGSDVTAALVYRILVETPSRFQFCRRHYRWRKSKLEIRLPSGYLDEYAQKVLTKMSDAFASKDLDRLDRCEESILGFLAHHRPSKQILSECIELISLLKQYRLALEKYFS